VHACLTFPKYNGGIRPVKLHQHDLLTCDSKSRTWPTKKKKKEEEEEEESGFLPSIFP
jgi:hypothetical protein